MKYGLMYYKATDNIGDDIQTYVAKKYLPHIDYYIDRESLSCFVPKEKEVVSMIMNGWYIHNKIAWPPSPYINPFLISMHFKSLDETDVGDSYLKGLGGEYLKKYGQVGARDYETLNRLEKNGISAYFSGCMTLTLEKFKNIEKKNKVILVDVEEDIVEKVKYSLEKISFEEVKEGLEKINFEENLKESLNKINFEKKLEYECLTHSLDPEESEKKPFEQRMSEVENILKKYQSAHLIITSRLHVALPSLALGTSVILLHKEFFDKDRLGSFFDLVDNYTNKEFLNMDIKSILKNPKPNSQDYIKIKENIDFKCKEFIKNCEKISEKEYKKLPEIEDFKKYADNLKWYKDIYEKQRIILEKIEHKRIEEFNNKQNELQKMSKENEMLNKKIEFLVEKYEKPKETTILVKNVYKDFYVYQDRANTVKEKLLFFARNKKEKREVLKEINLDIKKGEVVALIGSNGSGKSTLLKLMTKILYPNKGEIQINGKLTSLLELGAGFHPDFSGRENIYFNASIFGLTKREIDEKLDDIIQFSELQNFIDNPVRTYSSGMFMRLAFAVAINVNADILLVDEILSVGDEHFQNKCIQKMLELKAQGKTMVFVTHSMDTVKKLCDRAVWLSNGKINMDGNVQDVVNKYIEEYS